ncbi:hypothetical protein [Flavobacterium sp.]
MRSIVIALLFIGFSSFGQSLESLKKDTKKFYEANYLMDFETIVSYLYPKTSEIVGTEDMLHYTEQYYQNDKYRLRLQLETVPFQYGTIKNIEGNSFCVITLRNPMRYTFEAKLTSETKTEYENQLKKTHNTNEVTFEPNRNSFNVRTTTTFVAVSNEATGNQWKFFNFDDEKHQIAFRHFFAKGIQKELGL